VLSRAISLKPARISLPGNTSVLPTWFNTARQEAGTRQLFNLIVTGSLLAGRAAGRRVCPAVAFLAWWGRHRRPEVALSTSEQSVSGQGESC